ncbi:hypothetical protein C2S51_005868 [Perilla frutescens var. frutescens]|nr:hypothetical protein C2S51_005868 [Perilla frutescens var. frutescens]
MAVSQSGVLMVAAAIMTVFALVGTAMAQEAPAPAPDSAAGVAAPSFAVGCVVAVASLIFGSALRI